MLMLLLCLCGSPVLAQDTDMQAITSSPRSVETMLELWQLVHTTCTQAGIDPNSVKVRAVYSLVDSRMAGSISAYAMRDTPTGQWVTELGVSQDGFARLVAALAGVCGTPRIEAAQLAAFAVFSFPLSWPDGKAGPAVKYADGYALSVTGRTASPPTYSILVVSGPGALQVPGAADVLAPYLSN
jgi:hypothetical protein